jgi:hypothetical protein
MGAIMHIAVHELLLGLREALAIWLALVAITVIALLCMSLPEQRRRATRGPQRPTGRVPRAQLHHTRMFVQAEELARYAEEVAVAAERAGVTVERRHDEWAAAQRTQEAAWRAYEAADAAARRVIRAGAFPLPTTDPTPSEFASRERYLHRAATEAYRRGELTVEQLSDALAHRNGWDPRRHPFEQQAMLRLATRRQMLRAYEEASAIERTTWHAADMAVVAKRSLDQEASVAARRAREARALLTVETPKRRSPMTAARRPTLASR